MKLHLPSSLRKAVLACLAAFASLLPATIASGSVLAAGGFFSLALADDSIALITDEEDEGNEYGIMPFAAVGWTWDNPGNVNWGSEFTTIPNPPDGTNQTNPWEVDLQQTANAAYATSGASGKGHYKFTNGAVDGSLVLDHSAGYGYPVNLYFENCNIKDLWLRNTHDASSVRNNNNHFILLTSDGLDRLQNIYINHTGLMLGNNTQADMSFTANIILGSLDGRAATNDATLTVSKRNVTTTGYLEITEDTKICLASETSQLSVSDLRGDSNLELSTSGTQTSGATLTLRTGGQNYSGRLIFTENAASATKYFTLALGDAGQSSAQQIALNVDGLSGAGGVMIKLADGVTSGSTATVTVTGNSDDNNAEDVRLSSGVTLAVAAGASQTLTNTTITEGTLSIARGGTVVANGLTLNGSLSVTGSGAQKAIILLSPTGAGTLLTLSDSVVNSLSAANLAFAFNLTDEMYDDPTSVANLIAYTGSVDLTNFIDISSIRRGYVLTWNMTTHQFELAVSGNPSDNEVTWGNNANATWSTSGAEVWTNSDGNTRYYDGDHAVFDGDGGTVSIEGTVAPGDMTVRRGTWAFAGGTLSVGGKLAVNAGASADVSAVLADADLTIGGTGGSLKINGQNFHHNLLVDGSIQLEVANGNAFAGTLALTEGSILALKSDLTLAGNWGSGLGENVTINSADNTDRTFTIGGANQVAIDSTNFTFGEHVILKKTGSANYLFASGGEDRSNKTLTVQGKLYVESGRLQINGGAVLNDVEIAAGAELRFWKDTSLRRAITGVLSGGGSITAINQKLELLGGGSIGGNLNVGWDRTSVVLGADLQIGGMTRVASNDDVPVTKAEGGNDVVLTIDTAGSNKETHHITFGEGVTVKKTGEGTQKFGSGSAFNGSIEVVAGTLNISELSEENRGVIGQDLTFSGGTLDYGSVDLQVGRNLSVNVDTTIDAGNLSVGGTLTIASASRLTIGANRTAKFAQLSASAANGSLTLLNGVSATLTNANNGTLTALQMDSGSSFSYGGTLTLTNLTAVGGSAIHIGITGSEASHLQIGQANVTNGQIELHVSADDVKLFLETSSDGVYAFGSGSNWATLKDYFNIVIDGQGKLTASMDENGHIVFESTAKDMVWNGGVSGVWNESASANGWLLKRDSSATNFTNEDMVTFRSIDGVTSNVRVQSEIVATQLTVEDGTWVFSGSGSLEVTSGGMSIGDGATVTLSIQGAKHLRSVTLGNGSRLIITMASGWENSVVSGLQGELEFKGLNLDAEHDADMRNLLTSVIPTYVDSALLGSLYLTEGTDLYLGGADLKPNTRSIADIYVESGSSIAVGSSTMNVSDNTNKPTLHLSGAGVNGKGALYHTESTGRTVTWNITLEDEATVSVENSQYSINLNETYNGNGHTLTKIGAGSLTLNGGSFNTVTNSDGAFDVQEGTLTLAYTNNTATALANYAINVGADGTLKVGGSGNFIIKSLSGSEGATLTSSAPDGSKYGLRIENSFTEATEENIYAGTVMGNVNVTMRGGYELFSGLFEDQAMFTVNNESALELTGSFLGAGTVSVNNTASLKMVGATLADGSSVEVQAANNVSLLISDLVRAEDSSLTITATGNSLTLTGMELLKNDVLRFSQTQVTGDRNITLAGDTILHGGATLSFDVTSGDDGWATGVGVSHYTATGTLSYVDTETEKVKIEIDPYTRMADGTIRTLEQGQTYVLVSNVGADALEHFTMETIPFGRVDYELIVNDDGDLVVSVHEAAGVVVWNNAGDGEWNADADNIVWKLKKSRVSFLPGDAVAFTTMTDEDGEIISDITVTAASPVEVSAITVTGDTNYTLRGNITAASATGVEGKGLVVGTLGADGVDFTGTLTLAGVNSWTGDNIINSGTVVAAHQNALSEVETTLNPLGVLKLAFSRGATLASTLNLQGGVLEVTQNAIVNAKLTSATLNVAEEATLTAHLLEGSGAGYLRVNDSKEASGNVSLVLDTAEIAGTSLSVSAGSLSLTKGTEVEGGAVFSTVGSISVADDSTVYVGEGVTLSGNLLAAKGSVNMQSGSSLIVTGLSSAVGTIVAADSSLQGSLEGSGTKVANLTTVGDEVVMKGMWNVTTLNHASGMLTIADGTTTIDHSGNSDGVESIRVLSGATLKAGSDAAQLNISSLSLQGSSIDAGAARIAGGSNITTSALNITHGVVESGASIIFTGEEDTPVVGNISGQASRVSGEITLTSGAELAISDQAALDGTLIVEQGKVSVSSSAVAGAIYLNSAQAELDMNGYTSSAVVTMVSDATLSNTGNFVGTVVVDDTNADVAAGTFALGGLGSDASITLQGLRSVSRVTGVNGSLNLVGDSTIALGNSQRSQDNALIQFEGSAATAAYSQAEGASLTIDITAIANTITRAGAAGATYYVFNKGVMGSAWSKASTIFYAALAVYQMDVTFNSLTGSLTFVYNGPVGGLNIFYSTEQDSESETVVSDYDSMSDYAGVVLDRKTTVDLADQPLDTQEHPDGLVLRNVMSTENGELTVHGAGKGQTLVTFTNTVSSEDLEAYAKEHDLDIENVFVLNSSVSVTGSDLQISHVGNEQALTSSRTLINGRLDITDGDLLIKNGELALAGGADVEDVTFTNGKNGQLVVSNCRMSTNNIKLAPVWEEMEDAHVEHILIEKEGVLELKSGSSVDSGVVIGNANAAHGGSVSVSGRSVIASNTTLHHIVLDLAEGSRFTITPSVQPRTVVEDLPTDGVWNLSGLTGTGELLTQDVKDIDFTVAGGDHTFSGNLASYNGTMTFGASSDWQIFEGALGGDHWSLTNAAGGHVMLDMMGTRGRNSLTMENLTLAGGSDTWLVMDLTTVNNASSGLQLTTLNIEDGASVTIAQYGDGVISLEGTNGDIARIVLGAINVTGESNIGEDVSWALQGVRNFKKGSVQGKKDDEGNFYLEVEIDNTNVYAKFADNENSAAGAGMLWSIGNSKEIGGDLAMVDLLVDGLLNTETAPPAENIAKANRLMAAVAGSSTAALGEALSADLERQLRAIRNRTTTVTSEGERKSGVWLNAESNYHKQDADGMLPGFKLNGWGGTVGAHTEVTPGNTVGVALTAMYNDVESNGADSLKGDMDTYYLSAFAQLSHRAWRHTFVATAGTASVDVDRTVRHDLGSYTTSGSTDGFAFGLLYEVGYTVPLKEDYSVCMQPIFNVAWRLSNVRGYSEAGGTAALRVEDQSYSTVTFGAGARMQASVGSNAWNRAGLFEARALVKLEAGDRQGEAETAFIAAPNAAHGQVKSAERGAVGVELGAGVTVPMGSMSSVFADFSAELRSDYTNFNASLGYRINF